MADHQQFVLREDFSGSCLLIINRPDKLNALNRDTIMALNQAITEALADAEVRVIMIKGQGEKAFVAGADIAEFADFNPEQGKDLAAKGQELLFDLVAHAHKPVIAIINGYALGGGLELAMAAHMRVASTTAKMGLPETSLGLIPGYGGTQRLAQLIGKGRALELICTAGMIDAQRAYEMGLVNHIYPPEELMDGAHKLAEAIKKTAPTAVAQAIKAVNAGLDQTTGLQAEIEAFGACFGTEDFKEGTQAFLEKRKAQFPGR
jgi:enoyl-CoA hydratase